TICRPSRLNAVLQILAVWPSSRARGCSFEVCQSQTCAVPSTLAVTMSLPSGLNAALYSAGDVLFSRNGEPTGAPLRASQMRAVLSRLAVTRSWPSGLKATRDLAEQPAEPLCRGDGLFADSLQVDDRRLDTLLAQPDRRTQDQARFPELARGENVGILPSAA